MLALNCFWQVEKTESGSLFQECASDFTTDQISPQVCQCLISTFTTPECILPKLLYAPDRKFSQNSYTKSLKTE